MGQHTGATGDSTKPATATVESTRYGRSDSSKRLRNSTNRAENVGSTRPDPPKTPNVEGNSLESSDSENYYAATDETSSPQTKTFNERDICLIMRMKMGHIYNRWMGTLEYSTPATSKRCVVLTKITGDSLDVHWEWFVKRTLDLPSTGYLVDIVGIVPIKGDLHLIQAYFVCETLEGFLARTSSNPGMNQLSTVDVVRHVSGLLEGMELIQSFRFLHPGLSTRKVLVTNQGDCKLYDFCLSEDAARVSSAKKSKAACSLNSFAPEVVCGHEYTRASDVWSIAVVIWALKTMGSSPFTSYHDVSPSGEVPGLEASLLQELKNDTLFRCWKYVGRLRPTMDQLKLSYKEIFDSLDDSTYEQPRTDLYTSMNSPYSMDDQMYVPMS